MHPGARARWVPSPQRVPPEESFSCPAWSGTVRGCVRGLSRARARACDQCRAPDPGPARAQDKSPRRPPSVTSDLPVCVPVCPCARVPARSCPCASRVRVPAPARPRVRVARARRPCACVRDACARVCARVCASPVRVARAMPATRILEDFTRRSEQDLVR
jgi:hypothetical protein